MQKYVIALYIRLSLEDYKYDSMSIENQRMSLHSFVYAMPEAVNAEIIEFVDNGYSGANFERPKVQELIEMVKSNQINCIIVKDFSRFGRNSIETGYFIERVFPIFHTRFISINDNFDTNNLKGDTGGMDVAFKYLISEYYSRDMSMKTKSAKYAKMQRGEYQSKICPYGYRKSVDGRMEPDPETAMVVKLIFELASTGSTAASITKELFKRGIATPSEHKAKQGYNIYDISKVKGRWNSQSVLRILYDERYIGSYVIGKRENIQIGGTKSRPKKRDDWFIIPNHHEPIINKELFYKVQSMCRRFSLTSRKTRNYPLKSKIYCGCCLHALSRSYNKNTFYTCRHSISDEKSRCNDIKIYASDLEQTIFQTVKNQLELVLPSKFDANFNETSIKCSKFEKQLQSIEDEKKILYEQYILNEITLDTYRSQKSTYDDEICKLKNICNAVAIQAKSDNEKLLKYQLLKKMDKLISTSDGLTPELTELFIDKVCVFPDNRIEISYKVQDIFEA